MYRIFSCRSERRSVQFLQLSHRLIEDREGDIALQLGSEGCGFEGGSHRFDVREVTGLAASAGDQGLIADPGQKVAILGGEGERRTSVLDHTEYHFGRSFRYLTQSALQVVACWTDQGQEQAAPAGRSACKYRAICRAGNKKPVPTTLVDHPHYTGKRVRCQ